jgi:hypothetical protein
MPLTADDRRIEEALTCYDSLNTAVEQAGGGHFSLHYLRNMNAFELLKILAPNHIRFEYRPPRDANSAN